MKKRRKASLKIWRRNYRWYSIGKENLWRPQDKFDFG
jgi:hypothetical protein